MSMDKKRRDKKESFERLIEARMEKLSHDFKLIRNLANPYNYEFTKEQLYAILTDVNVLMGQLKTAFDTSLAEAAPRTEGDKPAKGRPRKIRILSSAASTESETPASVTKEIVEEAKTVITKPVIDDSDVPDFLKRKA